MNAFSKVPPDPYPFNLHQIERHRIQIASQTHKLGSLKKVTMSPNDQRHDIVVIGGSAGSLKYIKSILSRLPADLPASIFIVVHIPSDFHSYLPEVLASAGPLPVIEPSQIRKIKPATVYVAPPDLHMLLENNSVTVSRGPRENRHRPAIDPLFRSAARLYGHRVLGIILSGQLDDGSSGLMAVKIRGGLAVVQSTREAPCPDMPAHAKKYAGSAWELTASAIASLIVKSATQGASGETSAPERALRNGKNRLNNESRKASLTEDANLDKIGKPSGFTCPDCEGVMWEIKEGNLLRFRCRVGHAYTADSLHVALSDSVEDALWAAMRSLEEKSSLLRRIASRSANPRKERYIQEADGYYKHVETIQKILMDAEKLEVREKNLVEYSREEKNSAQSNSSTA